MEAKIESKLLSEAEFNRFGVISMVLLVVGCLGGIAVGLGAINYLATLILVIIPTMTTLSLLLAVGPMKWILSSAAISTVINVILITYFLIAG